jgi:hypothetical protein
MRQHLGAVEKLASDQSADLSLIHGPKSDGPA